MSPPFIKVFPIDRLASGLRASLDPEGTGDLSPEQAAAIAQVEANVAALPRG